MQDGYYVSLNGKIDPSSPLKYREALAAVDAAVSAGEPAAWLEKFKDGQRVEWDSDRDYWKL